MEKTTPACNKCVLDATTPGVSINAETGLCQFCEHFSPLPKKKKRNTGHGWILCSNLRHTRGSMM